MLCSIGDVALPVRIPVTIFVSQIWTFGSAMNAIASKRRKGRQSPGRQCTDPSLSSPQMYTAGGRRGESRPGEASVILRRRSEEVWVVKMINQLLIYKDINIKKISFSPMGL